MKKALLTVSALAASVASAFAQNTYVPTQGTVNFNALEQLLASAQSLLTKLVPFAITLAVVSFFWFLITFIWKGSKDPAEQQKSLKGMGFSILALFVMVAIWGIVGLIASIFGVGLGGTVPIPGVPRP